MRIEQIGASGGWSIGIDSAQAIVGRRSFLGFRLGGRLYTVRAPGRLVRWLAARRVPNFDTSAIVPFRDFSLVKSDGHAVYDYEMLPDGTVIDHASRASLKHEQSE